MRNVHVVPFVLMVALSIPAAHGSPKLEPTAVEQATFSSKLPARDHASPLLIKIEVLLDRAHFSPGEIDGKLGDNVKKALTAYANARSLPTDVPLTNCFLALSGYTTHPHSICSD